MPSEFAIKTNHLSKDFGGKTVIKDCNMNVKTGSLMSSHLLLEVELVADYIGFLDNGTLNCEAQTKDIIKSFPEGLENYFIKVIYEGIEV